MADETLALLQHSTHLYLLNIANLSKDMFYQQVCLLIHPSAFALFLTLHAALVQVCPTTLHTHARQSALVGPGGISIEHAELPAAKLHNA